MQKLVNTQDRESIVNKEYVKDIMKYVMMPGMAKAPFGCGRQNEQAGCIFKQVGC